MKDPKITTTSPRTLYRTKNDKDKQSFEVSQIESKDEELVINDEQILQFLEKFQKNKLVEILIERIEDMDTDLAFHNFHFDLKHQNIAIIFDVFDNQEDFIMLIKDIENNTFFPEIITDLSDQICFDQFSNAYFVRRDAETGSNNSVLKFNLKKPDIMPEPIFKENKSGFQIYRKVTKSNRNYISFFFL